MIALYLLPLLCAEVLGIPKPAMYALGGLSNMLYDLDPENPQQALFEMTGGGAVPVLTFLEMDGDSPKFGGELLATDESSSKEDADTSSEEETDEIKKVLDDVIAGLQDTRGKVETSGMGEHISLDVQKSIKDLKKLIQSLPGEPKTGQISILRKSISISTGKGRPLYKSKSAVTAAPSANTDMSTEAPVTSGMQTDQEKHFSLFPSSLEKYDTPSMKHDDKSKASFQKTTWKSSSLV